MIVTTIVAGVAGTGLLVGGIRAAKKHQLKKWAKKEGLHLLELSAVQAIKAEREAKGGKT